MSSKYAVGCNLFIKAAVMRYIRLGVVLNRAQRSGGCEVQDKMLDDRCLGRTASWFTAVNLLTASPCGGRMKICFPKALSQGHQSHSKSFCSCNPIISHTSSNIILEVRITTWEFGHKHKLYSTQGCKALKDDLKRENWEGW